MSRQKVTSVLLVFALAGVTVLAGCASQQRAQAAPQREGVGHRRRPQATQPAAAPAPTRTATQAPRRGWPTMRSTDAMSWSSMAYPTGSANTSAIGIEKGMPREVRLNQPFDYELVVTNLTNGELSGVVVTDDPQDGLRITGSSPEGRAGAGGYVWNLGSLAANESRKITVNAVAGREGNVGSCAAVTYSSLLCSTVPVVSPKLRLVKTGPAEVLKCDAITYQFEVQNTGTGTLRNVRVNDPLPDGLVGPNGQRNLTFDAGSLGAGQSKRFQANVKAERSGRFENRATASGAGGVNASSDAVMTVVRQPQLRIAKTCPEKSFIGRPLDYEITVTNTGDGVARDAVLEDQLPSGAQFVSASDGGRFAGGRVVWNLGSMQPRASKKVTLRVTIASAGNLRNTASARAYCADPVSGSCETVVSGIPAILLEVIDVEDPIAVGDNETYVITVTNQGSAPAQNVTIVCDMEDEMQFVSATGATRGSARGNQVTFEPLPSLAPKAKATWRVVVKAVGVGDVRFTTRMTSRMITRPVQETEATNFYQ